MDIKHDKDNKRFYLKKENQVSELNYKKIDEQTLDYYRTFVPKPLRGQGIAARITAFALDYAKDNQFEVIPSCPYVKNYADKHPEYASIIQS